jgi:hypothetical protein
MEAMSVNIGDRFSIAAFVAIASLSGCTIGSAVTVPGGSATSFIINPRVQFAQVSERSQPGKIHSSWMYTAQLYGNDAEIYKRNGNILNPFETLTGLSAPSGTVSTVNGWWYIANGGASNVVIYKTTNNGPTGPVGKPLADSGEFPVNVAVTPSRRLVAVSNGATNGSGAGNVTVYLDRQTEPSRSLTYGSDQLQGEGVAIDHQGNCYWSFNDPRTSSGSIVEFAGCNGSGTLVLSGIANAGGIVFDQSDNLYYVDQTSGVYKCKKTSQCKLFVPIDGQPTNLNFDLKQKSLWVADATGFIYQVDPKSGGYSKTPAYGAAPYGIAPSPGG